MKVAAYQAPLLPIGSMVEAIGLIRRRVGWCEAEGVEILCCPETILGGLADDAPRPRDFALRVDDGQLAATLAPLASQTVTTLVGFTEISAAGELYNAAAVFRRGAVAGVYRKLHPAIRRSVYSPGEHIPVFRVGGLTFGIVICNDSNFPELAKTLASRGATALFIPTNNALPLATADVVEDARNADAALASANRLWVVRADVAGRTTERISYGSSAITDPDGNVLHCARRLSDDLLVAEIGAAPSVARDG